MRPLSEQDHYEVLEVGRDAAPEEIEQAYRMALGTYQADASAVYSMFDEAEVDAIRERIEEAYHVLSDPVARRRYDVSRSPEVEEEPAAPDEPEEFAVSLLPSEAAPPPAALPGFDELDAEGDSSIFDGPRLRRSRLRRGLELDEVAGVTKISSTHLRYLEEEQFAELPAPVYVRGFVQAYARCVGLDPDAAARGYMDRYRAVRGERAPRWFGRR